MITTKISIKPHLAEYAGMKFGRVENGCIRFSDRTDIYHTIWELMERRPKVCPPDQGNVEIMLPVRGEGKSPVTYNYLSRRSQKIIERRIENIFLAELHDFVLEEKHRHGNPYIESIHIFMCRYDINSITEDGLKKNCYRWINTLRKREKRGYNRAKKLAM